MKNPHKLIILFALLTFVLAKSQYRVTNADTTVSRITLTSAYTGNDEYYLKPTRPIIKNLKLIFNFHAFYDFYIKIKDFNNVRYEVP